MREGEVIQRLIGRWLEYSRKRSNNSIGDFAKWLYQQENTSEAASLKSEQKRTEKLMEIGVLFGRLVNFTDLWAKLAFKDLPIRQFEDYTILSETRNQQNPTKNELANLLVNEKSTAFEIIKRLIRDKLLQDEIDAHDRRIRRVSLTSEGKKVLAQADKQAQKVAKLLMGDSDENDLDFILKKFRELNEFHTNIHQNQNYDSIEDLI